MNAPANTLTMRQQHQAYCEKLLADIDQAALSPDEQWHLRRRLGIGPTPGVEADRARTESGPGEQSVVIGDSIWGELGAGCAVLMDHYGLSCAARECRLERA